MKKLLLCILSLALLLNGCGFAQMDDESQQIECHASEIIAKCSVTISMSGNKITARGTLSANYKMEKLGASSLKIQEYRDGKWVTVASKLSSFSYNKADHVCTVSYEGTEGETYRAIGVFFATDGTLSDSISAATRGKVL